MGWILPLWMSLLHSRASTSWYFIVTCVEGWTSGRKSLYKHPISTARRYMDVVEAKPSHYGTGARKHR